MSYDILLLDADGTLFDFEAAELYAFKEMLNEHQIEYSQSLFDTYETINEKIWQELEKGLISQEDLKVMRFSRFIEAADLNGQDTDFAKSFMSHLADASILFDDAFDVVKSLFKHKTLFIITNGLKEVQQKRIRQSHLAPFVKEVVISDEIGITKPDPRIITQTLKKHHITDKANVAIVGDSLTSDIQGGINASITTIWYNPSKKSNHTAIKPDYEITDLNELINF